MKRRSIDSVRRSRLDSKDVDKDLQKMGDIYNSRKAFELPVWSMLVPLLVLCVYCAAFAALLPRCDGPVQPGLQMDTYGGYVLHSGQIVHSIAMVSFAVTLLLCTAAYAWLVNPFKRLVSLSVCVVSLVALVTYSYFVFHGVPSALSTDGTPFEPMRYLQWLFTTPIMIFAISCLTEMNWSNRLLLHTLEADIFMIVFGFLDRYFGPPLRYLWFALSCLAFLYMLRNFHHLFIAAQGVMVDELDRRNLVRVHVFTIITWSLFPLVRVASMAGYVDNNQEDMLNTGLDLATKLIYAVSLMVVSFMVMDQLLEKRLESALIFLHRERKNNSEKEGGYVTAAQTAYELKLLAYKEAVAWREEREAKLRDEGYPEWRAAALLDSTLSEYVALSAGNISAYMN